MTRTDTQRKTSFAKRYAAQGVIHTSAVVSRKKVTYFTFGASNFHLSRSWAKNAHKSVAVIIPKLHSIGELFKLKLPMYI